MESTGDIMKGIIKKGFAIILSSALIMTATLPVMTEVYATENTSEETTSGISVDGKNNDWAAMGVTLALNTLKSAEYKIAKSEDGSMIYFYLAGPTVSAWDGTYDWKYFAIKYGDSTFGNNFMTLENTWINPGAEVIVNNTASGSNPGVCIIEMALPVTDDGYEISFEGNTWTADDIPVFVPIDEAEVVYEGITIDGAFYDWAAVTKVQTEEENQLNGLDCIGDVACVFDGDYVYIYLTDGEMGCVANAGQYCNGRYSIVTDTGRTLTFEIDVENGGSVSGVEGATASYFGNEWEIAIPVSQLPLYNETISFGLYQQEPFVSDLSDLQGGEGTAGEFSGIVYDGLFGDWNAYPHTLIQYGTAGTQVNDPDGEGALYLDGSTLYGHVVSSMAAHLAEAGGEFASAITIYFNGDHNYNHDISNNVYPFLVAVAEDGTINWDPQTVRLENGTYEFYIADARSQYDRAAIKNISQLKEHEQFLGKMKVQITDTNDEIEFYLDLEQVATFLSYYSGEDIEASDFKTIEAQFGRIGNELLVIAGTSSGPYMGIVICVAVVVMVLVKRRRKAVQ